MATWLTHLRVAEYVLDSPIMRDFPGGVSRVDFLVGNIAPDCGVWTPEGFDPPSEITHFSSPQKDDCDWQAFAREYLPVACGKRQRSFVLGYISHLLTDIAWSSEACASAKRCFPEMYESDYDGFWRMVKNQWHGIDSVFLEQHPDFAPLAEFAAVERYDCTLLPYYNKNNVMRGVRRICRYYSKLENRGVDFTTVTPDYVEEFVKRESEAVARELKRICDNA